MKVGIITRPNKKGQIVIPKEMREELEIDATSVLNIVLKGQTISIFPVDEVITKVERENSYVEILKKTQGSWGNVPHVSEKRKKVELTASSRRKTAW